MVCLPCLSTTIYQSREQEVSKGLEPAAATWDANGEKEVTVDGVYFVGCKQE